MERVGDLRGRVDAGWGRKNVEGVEEGCRGMTLGIYSALRQSVHYSLVGPATSLSSCTRVNTAGREMVWRAYGVADRIIRPMSRHGDNSVAVLSD
jgi:hypothetical protein